MTATVNNTNTLHLMHQAAAWWWNKRISSLSDWQAPLPARYTMEGLR